MIILIAGPTHTGKTQLAQKLMECLAFPYFSIDLLKMGLIKSGDLSLRPTNSDEMLTDKLWPIVHYMIETAIQNKQNLIVEGVYIPFDYATSFTEAERQEITYLSFAFSEAYLVEKWSNISYFENVIEQRFSADSEDFESLQRENKKQRDMCEKYGLNCFVVDKDYQPAEILNWALKKVSEDSL